MIDWIEKSIFVSFPSVLILQISEPFHCFLLRFLSECLFWFIIYRCHLYIHMNNPQVIAFSIGWAKRRIHGLSDTQFTSTKVTKSIKIDSLIRFCWMRMRMHIAHVLSNKKKTTQNQTKPKLVALFNEMKGTTEKIDYLFLFQL